MMCPSIVHSNLQSLIMHQPDQTLQLMQRVVVKASTGLCMPETEDCAAELAATELTEFC